MHDSFDPTTIVFAILAIFVVWKLRSVLGSRTGTEKPPNTGRFSFRRRDEGTPPAEPESNVVRLPGAAGAPLPTRPPTPVAVDRWKGYAEPASPAAAGLDAIAAADPSFAAEPFLNGAKAAYEMIVTAFAAGQRATLEGLLAKDVYESFAAAIAEREAHGQTVETTFVSIDKTTIESAQVRARTAQITVRFASKLITVTRDSAGAVVEGSSDKVTDMNDIWTFARDSGSRDPNWKLVATEVGH